MAEGAGVRSAVLMRLAGAFFLLVGFLFVLGSASPSSGAVATPTPRERGLSPKPPRIYPRATPMGVTEVRKPTQISSHEVSDSIQAPSIPIRPGQLRLPMLSWHVRVQPRAT
jgi:hypothetical protein